MIITPKKKYFLRSTKSPRICLICPNKVKKHPLKAPLARPRGPRKYSKSTQEAGRNQRHQVFVQPQPAAKATEKQRQADSQHGACAL